jgi:hypothetical protein
MGVCRCLKVLPVWLAMSERLPGTETKRLCLDIAKHCWSVLTMQDIGDEVGTLGGGVAADPNGSASSANLDLQCPFP